MGIYSDFTNFLHFLLSEIIAFASYLPVTSASGPLPLEYSTYLLLSLLSNTRQVGFLPLGLAARGEGAGGGGWGPPAPGQDPGRGRGGRHQGVLPPRAEPPRLLQTGDTHSLVQKDPLRTLFSSITTTSDSVKSN